MTAIAFPVRSTLLFISTYLFPLVGFPLVAYAWWRVGHSWPFVVVVMGVPVVFGYVMPAILTGVIKRWRFTSGPRLTDSSTARSWRWRCSPSCDRSTPLSRCSMCSRSAS
jgi:hypothetical protein